MAAVDGGGGGLLVGIAREHHAHGVGTDPADILQHLDAVHAGHPHVHERHGVRAPRPCEFEGLGAAERGVEAVLLAETALEGGEQVGIVVDKEDLGVAHGVWDADASGMRIRKVVPRPTSLVKSTEP